MKIKNLLYLLWLGFVFTFSACGDLEEAEEKVIPAPESTMKNFFSYDNNQTSKTHAPNTISAIASNGATEFYFYMGIEDLPGKDATGNDHISFKITPEKLKPGWLGTYTLKSLPTTAAGDASVYYVHYTNPAGGAIFDSSWNTLEGNFIIMSYDAQNKLISGSYSLSLNQVRDPYSSGNASPDTKKVDIKITGTFKNVQVQ